MRDYREIISSQKLRFTILNFFKFIPDKLMLKILYRISMRKKLDLNNPITLNEKIQWLKLNDRNPKYSILVDKYAARDYIANILGGNYLVPLIEVYDSVADIDWDKLPERFVLKCTHGSHCNIICSDRSTLDIDKAKKDLEFWMKQSWYVLGREWAYKNVKPRIIAEEYITDKAETKVLTDYKFYCFDGKVDSVLLCIDREINDPKFYFFDKNWNLKRYNLRGRNAPNNFTIDKPEQMNEMFKIAEKLSKGFKFVRVDLYCSNGNIYFGELTLYPASGFDANRLPEADIMFGNLIKLD